MDRRRTRQRVVMMAWIRVVVVSVVLGLAAPGSAFRSVEKGAKVPGFTLPTTTGQQLEFAAGGDQAVVLTIVRQGQDKSAAAMKALGGLAEKFGDKVAVLAIVANPEDGDAAQWVTGTGVGYPVLLDNGGEVYSSYGVRVMPTTGIVKPDGTLAGTVNGYTRAFDDEVERLTNVALGLVSADDASRAAVVDPTAMKSETRKKAERSVEKARLLLKRKMAAKALVAAEEAVAADGEYVAGRVLLGELLLAESEDNAATALAHYEKALQLDPKNIDAKVGVARVKSIQGETDVAVALLQKAAMLNPKPEKVYFELGRVYERAGNYQNAVEAYRKALERLLR